MRILIGGLKQETATFNPVPTRYSDFHIVRGMEIIDCLKGTDTEMGGILQVLEACPEHDVVPTFAGRAVSGGPIADDDLDRLIDEMLVGIRKAQPADGVCLVLHGAMASPRDPDPEGRILSEVRSTVGSAPIVATIDLHAILTDRMLAAADILVPFHTYPHTDQCRTGKRAAKNLLRLLAGTASPTTARVRLPMLVRGDELLTATGLFGEAVRRCRRIEDSPGGLSAGVIIGNPFTDVPDLRSNVIVTMDGDALAARTEASAVAQYMWDNRGAFTAKLTPLQEAIRIASGTHGLTVFSDGADATASGAPGDSNAILRGLIEQKYTGKALVPIVDRPAVQTAREAGVGAEVSVSLGGTLDPDRHTPVALKTHVKGIWDGQFVYEDGTKETAGLTAVLTSGTITVMVTERPVYVVGRKVFQAFGLDPRDYNLVVVKSPNGFRPHYEDIANRIIAVDVPGAASANLRSLPYERCPRPIFPLDEGASLPGPEPCGPRDR